MERQEFLKRAGIGSVLVSFPLFADVAWAGDDDDDDRPGKLRYYFVAFSGVVPNSALTAQPDAIVMSGCGSFTNSRISGGGEYVRTNGTLIPNAPVNDTGSWKAHRLLGFTPVSPPRTWGVVVPGFVRMEVKMISAVDGRIRRPTLEVVCNVGPANIQTGRGPEGFTLSGGGLPTFVQLNPTVGLTFITSPVRRRDDDDDDD